MYCKECGQKEGNQHTDWCNEGGEVKPLASSAGYRRPSGEKLAAILVNEGVVDGMAVEDPCGYDNGKTLDAIYRAAARL